MRDLVDDAAGQRVQRLFLLRGERPEAAAHLFDLAGANLFELLLQADDGGRDLGHFEARHHALHFFGDQRLGVVRLFHALAQVGVDDFLQIVDVVEEDVVEVVDGGLDIARHGDIDQEHRLVAAGGDDALHLVLVQDVVRRAGTGDQDIHLGQHGGEACVLDRRALEELGHLDGALVRAIGDEDVRAAGAAQVARGEFAHLAGAHDHDGAVVERAEDLARQFDGGIADRDRHLADAGLGAHALGDAEGAGHQAIQPAAERAAILGRGVGGLELSQNLRLADHHGIQAGGDAEEMVDGVAAFVPVEVRPDGGGADGFVVGQEAVDDGLRVRRVLGGQGDFDAVAGGEDHGFADALARFQVGQRGGQRLLAEGQAFAHLDGRCLVAHACDQQLHCFSRRLPSRACAAQVTAEKPTTVSVMMAALRPRQPAVIRRQTMAR